MFKAQFAAWSGSLLMAAGVTLMANQALADRAQPAPTEQTVAQQPEALLTIIGRVSESSGYGVAGVAIGVWGGISATTDGSGFFTVVVPPGEYDLTPSAPALTFQPPSRRVKGSGTQAGQNFVIVAPAAAPSRAAAGPRTIPAFPSAMKGVVTVGGRPAPDGSVIAVLIDGVQCATHPARVTTEGGGLYFLAIIYGVSDSACSPGPVTVLLDGRQAATNIALKPGMAMDLDFAR